MIKYLRREMLGFLLNIAGLFGSLSNRVDETILVKELSSVRLLNSFFSCWSK